MVKKEFWRAHCQACDYITSNKYKWNRHLNTEKHKLKRDVWDAEYQEMIAFLELKKQLLARIRDQKELLKRDNEEIKKLEKIRKAQRLEKRIQTP